MTLLNYTKKKLIIIYLIVLIIEIIINIIKILT